MRAHFPLGKEQFKDGGLKIQPAVRQKSKFSSYSFTLVFSASSQRIINRAFSNQILYRFADELIVIRNSV